MPKLDQIQKIALSGLLLALTIVFTRFLSIQNIPIIPFVRISLGPCLIIFSSLLLGPIYGGIVGGLSDILGIVLVPNALGYGINPFFTVVYTLLGILPWVIYKLVIRIKNEKVLYFFSIGSLSSLFIFLFIFLMIKSDIVLFSKAYHFEWWVKLIILVTTFVFTVATSVGLIFINKYFKNKYKDKLVSPYKVAFISVLSELIVLLILNTIVKQIFFKSDFLIIFFSQAIVFFINIALDTFVISLLSILVSKVFKSKEINLEKERN